MQKHKKKKTTNVRRNGQDGIRASTADPLQPRVGSTGVHHAILKVPIVAGVGEVAVRVVRSHGVSAPSRDTNAEVFDVRGVSGEVDPVNVRVDGGVFSGYDANVGESSAIPFLSSLT